MKPDELVCNNIKCKCEQHSEARDKFVLDIMSAAIEASHEAIPLQGGGGPVKASKAKPGWKDDVKPQRSDAIFWHSVWRSAGRPNTGQLFEQMKYSFGEPEKRFCYTRKSHIVGIFIRDFNVWSHWRTHRKPSLY